MTTTSTRRRTPGVQHRKPKQSQKTTSKKKKTNPDYEFHWSLTLTIVFGFVGFFTCFLLKYWTEIDWISIFVLVLIFGGISAAAQFKLFKKLRQKKGKGPRLVVGPQLYMVYNIAGVGFIATGLFLVLNLVFAASDPVSEYYKNLGRDSNFKVSTYSGVVFLLEGNKYEEDVDMRWTELKANSKAKSHPYFRYDFYEGPFGFRIFGDRYFSSEDKSESIEVPYIKYY